MRMPRLKIGVHLPNGFKHIIKQVMALSAMIISRDASLLRSLISRRIRKVARILHLILRDCGLLHRTLYHPRMRNRQPIPRLWRCLQPIIPIFSILLDVYLMTKQQPMPRGARLFWIVIIISSARFRVKACRYACIRLEAEKRRSLWKQLSLMSS